MRKAVFGLVQTQEEAQRVVQELEMVGFVRDDISVLFANQTGSVTKATNRTTGSTVGFEKQTKASEGAAMGGVVGGTIGLLAGLGTLAIPGLGAFVAAGPLLAALSGSAIGGSLGLLVGSLVGMGIPEYEAKQFESSLKAGKVLIAVHVDTNEDANKVTEIFQKTGVFDICTAREISSTYK